MQVKIDSIMYSVTNKIDTIGFQCVYIQGGEREIIK